MPKNTIFLLFGISFLLLSALFYPKEESQQVVSIAYSSLTPQATIHMIPATPFPTPTPTIEPTPVPFMMSKPYTNYGCIRYKLFVPEGKWFNTGIFIEPGTRLEVLGNGKDYLVKVGNDVFDSHNIGQFSLGMLFIWQGVLGEPEYSGKVQIKSLEPQWVTMMKGYPDCNGSNHPDFYYWKNESLERN